MASSVVRKKVNRRLKQEKGISRNLRPGERGEVEKRLRSRRRLSSRLSCPRERKSRK